MIPSRTNSPFSPRSAAPLAGPTEASASMMTAIAAEAPRITSRRSIRSDKRPIGHCRPSRPAWIMPISRPMVAAGTAALLRK